MAKKTNKVQKFHGPLWGVDLGLSRIEGVILEDREDLNVFKRLSIPTEAKKGYDHIIDQIARVLEVLTSETGIKPGKLGISTPGTLEPSTRLMKNCSINVLNGKAFQRDLEIALGLPVILSNESNCFTIAETELGIVSQKAPDSKVVVGVNLDEIVGGGLIINGQIIKGRQGIAGEWGHNFLDKSGGECSCGKIGCVETIISGPALEKYYQNLMGIKLDMPEIVRRYREGEDEVAEKTVHRLLEFFGKSMANVINVLDPDVIVLGGRLAGIEMLYSDGIWEVEKHVFNDRLETEFLPSSLGDSAKVYGAALL